ncbi:MAG: T9SS type A sorting domain-containing protein [Chitinophagaceae bacterium]|nr:T9SS type A sorting domain-containing protein [Chitinophagaceae bacterium]
MKKLYATLSLLLAICTISMAQPAVIDDDYAAGVSFVDFGGATNSLSFDAANARPGSAGTKSLKIEVPAGGYTGGAMMSAANTNLSTYNAVTFWVKASKAVTLNVSGLGNNGSSAAYQTELQNVAVTTAWVKVIIPIPDPAKLTATNGLFHFAEGSDEGAYTLWIDDIMYENLSGVIGTPTAVMDNQNITKAVGGTFTATGVRATFPVNSVNKQLTLTAAYLSYTSNPTGRITFDATGTCTAATVGAATVTATLQGVAVTGSISVTVSGAASEPTTAADTPPARSSGDVISVYSHAYTNVTGINWNPNWSQSTIVSEVQVAGNATRKYANLNYQGFEFTPALNVSGMSKLHFDIWSPDCTQFQFFLISPGPVEVATTVVPTLSGWKSVDVDLSGFSPVVLSNVFQFKIVGTPFGTSTVWLDNIYFYKDAPLPVKFNGFTAAANAGAVLLKWGTASESNNKGFTVEKSADGLSWSDIGFVAGAGNSNSQRQYVFTDNKPGKGNNYYRLKQTDLDGKQAFSEVRMVNMQASRGAVSVFPNPAKGMVYLNSDAVSGTLQYQLLSMNGKAVLSGQVNVSNGQQSINIQTVPAGTYLLRLTANGVSSTEKLIVQ